MVSPEAVVEAEPSKLTLKGFDPELGLAVALAIGGVETELTVIGEKSYDEVAPRLSVTVNTGPKYRFDEDTIV